MKSSTRNISICRTMAGLTIALSLPACDSATPDTNCNKSGWGVTIGEQAGGDFAVATPPGPGNAWTLNFDSVTNKAGDRITCGLTSVQPVATGVHDNFSCQRSTGAGAQESWSAAQLTEMDLRPTVTITSRDDAYLTGTIEGIAFNTAIVVTDNGVSATDPVYVPFKLDFTATYNPGLTCDSGLDIDEPAVVGCSAQLLRAACASSPNCEPSGTSPAEQCASATEMIAIPAMPDVNKCVEVVRFIRNECQ